ncbi:unnamed protein product [Rhizoctonia solani]|uniref:Fungal lipase-type domain-containing protein n=1 Tax=Rhizoctonia solani TaxID=456999 RepID=A0A8H2XT16_9AGAM|nr:unnamed protein product [Rhizoctonia solani]
MLFSAPLLALVLPLGALAGLPDVTSVVGSVIEDAKLIKVGDAAPLSTSEIDSYIPYGYFSAVAYCPPETRDRWQCKSCQADSIKDFQLYKSGGDGDLIQYWYVGWWPAQNSVVVGRQGTDFSKLWPVVTDVTLVQVPADHFSGCPSSATVHLGFLESHKRSIDFIFEAVQAVLKEHKATKILTVGHSLGAALAMLDGLYMETRLRGSAKVFTRTFGGPRVGNKAFADYFDAKIADMVRITNKRDPIPILPPGDGLWLYAHSGRKTYQLGGGMAWLCRTRELEQELFSRRSVDQHPQLVRTRRPVRRCWIIKLLSDLLIRTVLSICFLYWLAIDSELRDAFLGLGYLHRSFSTRFFVHGRTVDK